MPHTPGPWKVVDTHFIAAHEGQFGSHAEVYQFHTSPDIDPEQHDANARLIAAAPCLLEALRMMVRGLEWRIENHPQCIDPSDYEALTAARLAILKAVEPG